MKRPHQAVLLAAGFGTRMLPLSAELPKPLLPLWGQPLLLHSLARLRRWGVRDVLLNLHHQPNAFIEVLRRAANPMDLRIAFSFEPEILGTGGALSRAAWFLDDGPFWMLNADVVLSVSPAPFLRVFAQRHPLAALWLHPALGPRTVDMSRGVITGFRSRRAGSPGTYTFCGLQLLDPAILNFIPDQEFSTIVEAYEKAQRRGKVVWGIAPVRSYWADVGTPSAYRFAHAEIRRRFHSREPGGELFARRCLRTEAACRRRQVVVRGFAAMDSPEHVAPGAAIEDSILLAGARVAAKSRLQRVILAPDTAVRGNVRDAIVMRADRFLDPDMPAILAALRWHASSTTVIPLGARGSARVFLRLQTPRQQAIMIRYSLERPENGLYARHARLLAAAGVPVPRVFFDWPKHQVTVIEDLGDDALLAHKNTAARSALLSRYERVLAAAARLHTAGTRLAAQRRAVLSPPFTLELYHWEHKLFAEQLLISRLGFEPGKVGPALRDLAEISRNLSRLPRVLIHRDLQSSNIHFKRGRPYFIDFQGMRFGPALYDLASLLCDPYMELDLPAQMRLLDYYSAIGDGARIRPDLFWCAAVQRLGQALGAYGRLCSQPETADFARHIAPALKMLQRALDHLGGLPNLREVVNRAMDIENRRPSACAAVQDAGSTR
jgi:NDP-sugar pyrophosphorylase family protein/aminoglycoside/choline kinase family phosphotransferase